MAVGGNHRQGGAVIPAELVESGVGTVQHAQTIGAGRHRQHKMTLAIDNHFVAKEAHVAFAHVLHINQLIVCIKTTVLQHDGLVKFSPREVEGLFIRV